MHNKGRRGGRGLCLSPTPPCVRSYVRKSPFSHDFYIKRGTTAQHPRILLQKSERPNTRMCCEKKLRNEGSQRMEEHASMLSQKKLSLITAVFVSNTSLTIRRSSNWSSFQVVSSLFSVESKAGKPDEHPRTIRTKVSRKN